MKLQNLAVIFIIITIPLILIIIHYIGLQKETILLQTEYDEKLIASTKEAISALEINTVEWNGNYAEIADSKRRDVSASINTFVTSLSNNLVNTGTSREYVQNYIPAVAYILYDGYYVYAPTYIAKTLTNEKGVQLYYYKDETEMLVEGSTKEIGGEIVAGQVAYVPENGSNYIEIDEKGYYYTLEPKEAVKEYKHTLKNYITYSESIGDVIVNYTLDNYVRIFSSNKEKQLEGYLVYFDKVQSKIPQITDTVTISVGQAKYNGIEIQPETLTEQISHFEIVETEKVPTLKTYKYIYNIDNEKLYYDEEEERFFRLSEGEKKYLKEGIEVGSSDCEYKSVSILTDTYNYTEIYQVLNGKEKGNWYKYDKTTGVYTKIGEELLNVLEISKEQLTLDFSAINYYVEAYAFTNKINKLKINETFFQISKDNNPENQTSLFAEHRKEIMQNSINNSLNIAIQSYSVYSESYDYELPELLETDWDQAFSNVSIITFFQGMQIGLKYYNNYAIATSSSNEEYLNQNALYYIGEDTYYHRYNCEENTSKELTAYSNTEFIVQTDETTKQVYYMHYNSKDGKQYAELACYKCIVNRLNYEEGTSIIQANEYKKARYTALARERHRKNINLIEVL